MVYLDLVMALNFLVDFLLILGANSLSGFPPGYRRAAAASAVGGIYGGVCLLPGFSFLGRTLWHMVFFAIMAVIAFGTDRSALRRGAILMLLSMALGGIAMGLDCGVMPLILSACGLYIACAMGYRSCAAGDTYCQIELWYKGRRKKFMALRDTGNTLRDPVTGHPVLVVSAAIGRDLQGLTDEQLASPIETMQSVSGLRLIPYRAVGQPGGMLLAVKPDLVRIDGKEKECLVAFAPQDLGMKVCEALAGGML